MEAKTPYGAVHSAFGAALLLACDATTAEAAVLDGIDACEDVSHRHLWIEVVGSTLRRRTHSADKSQAMQMLPPELCRLFRLQPLLRDCFVLRILLGLSPKVSADLLKISVTEFENACYAALLQVPVLLAQTPSPATINAVE